jgi:phage-related protein
MDKDLWEVRSNISDGRIARVLFTVCNIAMVLLHGFVKKSKSTPRRRLIWILPKNAGMKY